MGKPNNSLAKIKLPGENTQRPIIPYAVSDGTYLASVPTMTEDDTLALASNIPSISLVTTEGSESITVNSDTLNLMTTDTNQKCNCYKTFSRTQLDTIYETIVSYDGIESGLLDSNEEMIRRTAVDYNGLSIIDVSLNDLSENVFLIQADSSRDKICFRHGQFFGTTYNNYLPKKTGTLVVEEDVSAHQSTSVIVGNAVTNINGRVFQNYTATLVTAGGYTFYQILKNGNNPTEEEAKEYMRYMTGSTFLPKYNYDFPKQTVFTFADRSTWKPQYSSNDGLRLYRLTTPLALASDIPTVNNGTLTIQSNGTSSGTFTANQSGNTTVNLKTAEVIDVTNGVTEAIKNKITANPAIMLKHGEYYFMPQYSDSNLPPNWYNCFEGDSGSETFHWLEIDWDGLTVTHSGITYATQEYVQQYVGKPMVFQGTVGTGGTVTWANLPTASNANKGYTYKVITDHTADSKCPACKVGDTIISNGSAWVVIPSGDEDTDTVREIKVNGTTQLNTGISSGYVNFKNGTNTTVSFSNSHDIQINATDTNTQYQLKTYDATATGRIAYLSDASSSGSNTVSKSTHTHTVTATGSVSLGSSTSTDGVKYVESITSNPAGEEGKYMHFSAGTTPPSAATPNTTSTTSGANSGSAVSAITLLSSEDSSLAIGDIAYIASHTNASLGTASTGTVTISGGSASGTTKYMSGSFSGTTATITPTLNAGTTKYLSASFSGTAATITPTLTGTKTFVTTALKSASTAGSRATSGSGATARRTLTISTSTSSTGSSEQGTVGISGASYTPAGSITLTANDSTATGRITYLQSQGTITGASYTPAGSITLAENDATATGRVAYTKSVSSTAPSLGGTTTFVTGYPNFSGGGSTTKYLHKGTTSVAPNAHTHSYDKTTSVSLTAGNAPSMTYNSTASGGEYYVTNVTGGGATPTTKYFHPSFSGTSATTSDGSNATATASTGVSKTTKYLNLEEK